MNVEVRRPGMLDVATDAPSSPTEMPVPTELPTPTSPGVADGSQKVLASTVPRRLAGRCYQYRSDLTDAEMRLLHAGCRDETTAECRRSGRVLGPDPNRVRGMWGAVVSGADFMGERVVVVNAVLDFAVARSPFVGDVAAPRHGVLDDAVDGYCG